MPNTLGASGEECLRAYVHSFDFDSLFDPLFHYVNFVSSILIKDHIIVSQESCVKIDIPLVAEREIKKFKKKIDILLDENRSHVCFSSGDYMCTCGLFWLSFRS
jgi:hypothetical protein